ncbi:MAG TPA: YbaK/EbsC family protein [Mariprofundaceae bacterium]|nr:YbaK/EbsC family protein [Mariprofundaceae bacterium]
MAIASRVERYLQSQGVSYEVLTHPYTASSMETAHAAHVSGDAVAKAIVLKDDRGYLMAVLPATHDVDVERLNGWLHRHLDLAPEGELSRLFEDCDPGAVPPIGAAYHIETVMDESLVKEPDIYFEAGNHRELVHMQGMQFDGVEAYARWGAFSQHK